MLGEAQCSDEEQMILYATVRTNNKFSINVALG